MKDNSTQVTVKGLCGPKIMFAEDTDRGQSAKSTLKFLDVKKPKL